MWQYALVYEDQACHYLTRRSYEGVSKLIVMSTRINHSSASRSGGELKNLTQGPLSSGSGIGQNAEGGASVQLIVHFPDDGNNREQPQVL